ncbi:hypothetical protein SKAU_G00253970 [Synaphobranchus kaupii]|uniref:Uncharacterized protein n=1 Tax=Synaphobranchus kaupii TaxID=118154 RepID=A0A9Q1F3T2_SYNKA|nr:hypothetical protein SKAU_G00253970 [Synaphobranchus kaupii]
MAKLGRGKRSKARAQICLVSSALSGTLPWVTTVSGCCTAGRLAPCRQKAVQPLSGLAVRAPSLSTVMRTPASWGGLPVAEMGRENQGGDWLGTGGPLAVADAPDSRPSVLQREVAITERQSLGKRRGGLCDFSCPEHWLVFFHCGLG